MQYGIKIFQISALQTESVTDVQPPFVMKCIQITDAGALFTALHPYAFPQIIENAQLSQHVFLSFILNPEQISKSKHTVKFFKKEFYACNLKCLCYIVYCFNILKGYIQFANQCIYLSLLFKVYPSPQSLLSNVQFQKQLLIANVLPF